MLRPLLFLSSALTVVTAGAALAADLPNTKGEPVYAPPPVPVFTWTGLYIGVNGGYGGDDVSYTTPAANSGSVNTAYSTGRGFVGGGTVGFNYQLPTSNFVLGFEGDFDWSNIGGAQFHEGYIHDHKGSPRPPKSYSEGTTSDWLATARLRLGYALTTPFGNHLLPYVTGGAAFGSIEDYGFPEFANPYGAYNHTRTGWAAGAGLEFPITQNLTFKTEYLHIDLGSHNIDDEFGFPGGPANTEHFTANIVRAGLNWKFDWFAPPAPAGTPFASGLPNTKGEPAYAPPPPVFTWTGFYIGVNGGYGGDDVSYSDPSAAASHGSNGIANQAYSTGRGIVAGATVGFNYELPTSNFVLGFEGDFDWSNIGGPEFSEGRQETHGYVAYNEGTEADWLATARVRLGYAVTMPFGNLLPYVTGGAAFGAIKDYGFGLNNNNFTEGATTHTWVGWAAGAGLEYAITQNLTFKTEYLHIDLGSQSINDDFIDPGSFQNTEHFTANIVRAGLNWKFDWFPPPPPVTSKY